MISLLKASAGSGKTFNLAREYIRLVLTGEDPFAYRHVLAVTFTNKATDEMKRRILQELYILAVNPSQSPYYQDFVPSVFATADALRTRAGSQLSGILHDYSSFAVSTIDKFFQQTLRAFAREIGQFASYQVELDKEMLVEESVDRILDELTEDDRSLLDWLSDSVRSDLEKGNRFNLEARLREFAMSLRSDDHDEAVARYGIDEETVFSRKNLREVRRRCHATVESFVSRVRDAAEAVLSVLSAHGIPPQESNRGFLKALYAYSEADGRTLVKVPSDTFLSKARDSSLWFAKSKDRFRLQLEGSLEGPLEAFCALFDRPYKAYRTALIIRDQIYGLGIAGEIRRAFTDIQKEKNVISIDDSNTILKNIIDGSDAPFVYEKLGVRYEDFLLDEFQDTSSVQWENFRPLLLNSEAGGFDNLVVGDVKQSIYRWRGSDWKLLDSKLSEEFGLKPENIRVLDGNYRTLKGIVDFNNRFFPFAARELDRLLGEDPEAPGSISTIYRDVVQEARTRDDHPGSVDIVFCEDQMEEIVTSVRDVLAGGGTWGDIAILVRGNAEGSEIAARLVAENIPVISDDSLFVKASVTVRRLVSQLSLTDRPDGEDSPSVGGFLARTMQVAIPESYHSLVDLSESLLRDIREADPESFAAEVPYIQSFMDWLQDWVGVNGNNLAAFLRDWKEAEPIIASPDTGGSVRVMTIHKSKGLEFPYVILPFAEKVSLYKPSSHWCRPAAEGTPLEDLGDGIFHVQLSSASEETLFAEDFLAERKFQYIDNINIFYVALTRAKYGLKVISARPSDGKMSDRDWKNLSQVLYGFVDGQDYHAGEMYPFGSVVRRAPEAVIEAGYPSYPVDERNRLRFSGDALDYFGPDGQVGPQASARRRGLVLHEILSGVTVPEDLPRAVDREVRSGALESSERDETLAFLSGKIAAVPEWFPEADARVLNEVSILDTDGREYRPDRVVVAADGSVTVIDYKFGARSDSYVRQIGRYADLFRRMGHPRVEAYLWYVLEDVPEGIDRVC